MNKKMIAGRFYIAVGKMQEHLATCLGNAELRREAQKRQIDGRIMHAVGEAQDLIKRSLRHRLTT